MEKNMPTLIVNKLYKKLMELSKAENGKYDFEAQELIKNDIANITAVPGAIEVMSKTAILKLIKMQSRLRFMPHHSFYIYFAKACDDITKDNF